MNLNTLGWQSFYLKDLYDIQMGNGFDKNKLDEENPEVNLVSRVSYNNGVDVKVGYVDDVEPFEAGLVTVALGGSYLGSCFVQEEPFYTGQNVAVMKSKYDMMTKSINIFISGLVRFEAETKYYAFGRELNTHIRKDFDVKLPVKHNADGTFFIDKNKKYSEEGYVPDWQFMEDYIKSLHHKPLTTQNTNNKVPKLNTQEWEEFYVSRTPTQSGLLEIENCKCGSAGTLDAGNDINYIGAKKNDNGVMRKVVRDDSLVSRGNGILFICDGEGSVGYTNYMDEDFIGSTTTSIGYDEALNPYIALFLVSILDKEKFKYSYGRKYRAHINKVVIKLPIQRNISGLPVIDTSKKYSKEGYVPDWEFMEDYIKSLPYGDRL